MLFGFLIQKLLSAINTVLVVDMIIVWYAFLLGYISHLAADMLTREGVPLLSPLKALRIKTGGWGEKFLVFPSLILFNGYIISTKYSVFLSFLRSLMR